MRCVMKVGGVGFIMEVCAMSGKVRIPAIVGIVLAIVIMGGGFLCCGLRHQMKSRLYCLRGKSVVKVTITTPVSIRGKLYRALTISDPTITGKLQQIVCEAEPAVIFSSLVYEGGMSFCLEDGTCISVFIFSDGYIALSDDAYFKVGKNDYNYLTSVLRRVAAEGSLGP